MTPAQHRCEIMFIARITHVIALNGMKWNTREEYHRFVGKAWEAVIDPVKDLNANAKEFIRVKVNRMEDLTLKPACHKSFSEKILLIGYYFMKDLLDRKYIKIPDESALMQVMDYLLKLVDPNDEGTQKRMESAQKQARKWLEVLQGNGYFIEG